MRYLVLPVVSVFLELALAQNAAVLKQASGVVAGIVVQEPTGTPLGKVVVSLSSSSEGVVLDGSSEVRNNTFTAVTEPDGHFRIEAVPPGEYSVGLNHEGFVPETRRSSRQSSMTISVSSNQTISDLRFSMESACVITGKVVGEDGDPVAGVSVTAKAGQSGAVYGSSATNDLGEFRIAGLRKGEYVVVAQSMSQRFASRNDSERTYAPTYYPGTTDLSQAVPVDMRPGEESKLDLTLISTQLFHARGAIPSVLKAGKAQNPGTNASGLSILLEPVGDSPGEPNGASIQQDGTFEIDDMLPGSYRAMIQGDSASVNLQPLIEINNSDADGLELEPTPIGDVRGHFNVERGDKPDLSQFSIILKPIGDENPAGMLFSQTAKDGSFVMKDVQAGDYEVIVNTTTPSLSTYYVKDLKLDGRSDPNSRLHVTGDHTIEVLLNAHGASIQGVLVDEDKQPLADAQVICVPSGDQRRPSESHLVTTDKRGQFNVQGLPSGEYKVMGLDDLVEDPTTPEFLAQHDATGLVVKVDEGQHADILLPATHIE